MSLIISPETLQAQPPFPAEAPLDTTVIALQAADVLPDALLEKRLPGHELETEPVVDHGEASADKTCDAGEAAAHILAGICWHVGQAAISGHLVAGECQ